MKTWIIPLAVLMVAPALGAAAPIVVGAVPEQLVEGHTVFTVIEQVNATATNKTQFAAAVAVLVREAHVRRVNERFPGVLWFNDQYLVDPVDNSVNRTAIRYPCVGAVLAVNSGAGDPRPAFATVGGVSYIESYLITDPNDHQWNVDKWTFTSGTGTSMAWTVAILDNQAGYDQPDDGESSCNPYSDGALAALDGGPTYMGAPDSTDDYTTPGATSALKYNAVLFFFFEDLTVGGAAKTHHSGAPVAGDDISGCQTPSDPAFPDQWPCPAGNDNAEGNSHPYNPFYMVGDQVCAYCVGRGNHGGSAVTPPGSTSGDNTQYAHGARNIDLYYGPAAAPTLRMFRVIDTEGSTAPFFCEDDFALCLPNDL